MSTIPKRLGNYELQQRLGQGSVGEVWKGYDVELRRDVAIKIIHTDLQSDSQFLTRFLEEGQAVASLQHANIVTLRDVRVFRSTEANETTAFTVMDYVEGQTLAQYLNMTSHRGMFPSIGQIVYLFTSLGVAIDYAHQRGIVHGNIRPGNILLNKENTTRFEAGEPMLTDFGLHRMLSHSEVVGSPSYMSPEQAKGEPPNNRSDIYALGVMLYEICTGVQPFRDESSVAILMQHIDTLPTPPSLINPNIPAGLSEVILRAMAKDTATRFPIASLLATAIADACSVQPTLPTSYNKFLNLDDPRSLSGPHPAILGVSQPLPQPRPSSPLPPISRPMRAIPPMQPAANGNTANSGKLPTAQPGMGGNGGNSTKMPAMQPGMSGGNSTKLPTMPKSQTTASLPISEKAITGFSAIDQAMTASQQATSITPLVPMQPAQQQDVSLPSYPPTPMPAAPPPTAPYYPAASYQLPPQREAKKGLRFTDTPVYVVTAALLLLLLVIGSAITMNLILKSQSTPANQHQQGVAQGAAAGQVYFQDDALGHDDVLRMQVQNLPAPQQGQAYYAWLLDMNQHSRLLGKLIYKANTGSLQYAGDAAHTNLLSILQSVYITQEDDATTPAQPAGSKLYEATFSSAASSHIRDILTATPGLPGKQSVVSSITDTIKSINDKAGSIVDSLQSTHDYGLARRQAIRIIELIDGTANARSMNDLPANDPSLAFTRIGLLSSPTQKGLIDILDTNVQQVQHTADNNTALAQHAQNVENAVTDLRTWAQKMRGFDVQIVKASDLTSPAVQSAALQVKQAAADSYTGRTIPPNDGPQPTLGSAGANQAFIESQYMATLDLHKV